MKVSRGTYPDLFARLLAHSEESETYSWGGMACWCWKNRLRNGGYGRLAIRIPGRPKPVQAWAHRLMAEIVLGRKLDPHHETIEHLCEIPWCINPWHFAIATRSENTKDARARHLGKPRVAFKPMLDRKVWLFDPLALTREMPRKRTQEMAECPF